MKRLHRMRGQLRLGEERGSAGVVMTAIIGATLLLTASWLGVAGVLVAHQRASAAADAAALAAADTVSGWAAGEPCALAAQLASAMGAELSRCETTGSDAQVTAVVRVGPVSIGVAARAGPPPLGSDS